MSKKIEVLGTGCAKCHQLEDRAKSAAKELGIEADFAKVTDIKSFAKYGVMMTPALVIDGVVKAAGKIPEIEQIKEWLK